jgi:hypothetical protein
VVEQHVDFQMPVAGWNSGRAQDAREVERSPADRGDGTPQRHRLERADSH